MKIFTIIILFLSFTLSYSQNLEIRYNDTLISSGDTLIFSSSDLEGSISVDNIKLINNSSVNYANYGLKKIEIDVVQGSKVTFCWADYCYPSSVYTSPHTNVFNISDTITNFSAHFKSYGNTGISYVYFVFYDADNPTDSIYITTKFIITNNDDIDYISALTNKIYPNPVNNNLIIENDIAIKNIKIFNINGEILIHKDNINSKFINLDLSYLNKGLYIVQEEFKENIIRKPFVKN